MSVQTKCWSLEAHHILSRHRRQGDQSCVDGRIPPKRIGCQSNVYDLDGGVAVMWDQGWRLASVACAAAFIPKGETLTSIHAVLLVLSRILVLSLKSLLCFATP